MQARIIFGIYSHDKKIQLEQSYILNKKCWTTIKNDNKNTPNESTYYMTLKKAMATEIFNAFCSNITFLSKIVK